MSNEKVIDFIKDKVAKANNFDSFERAIRYTFNRPLLQSEHEFITKLIDESIQAYADKMVKERVEGWRLTKAEHYRRTIELESENASLKEFPNWLLKNCFMRVLEGGKGEWHMRGEVGAYSSEEMFEKFKLLTNESDEKPKEGTGSINPTVTMHNDFADRIGRDLKR